MKLYKPLFSIITILVQLFLSVLDYYDFLKWKKENPELDSIITIVDYSNKLFLFVLIIGFYEMLTKPGWFKITLRLFLVCIVLGTSLAWLFPIDSFYASVYNVAWFSAVVAIILILFRIGQLVLSILSRKNSKQPNR